ncbi:MAG: hypothetical protein HQK83_11720, partial [Fibrobacteria bacterium]|nr:hypothetical protein [Fibrobacteria bacterium]
DEQKFQVSGCTSNECLIEIGQLLGVTHIITGGIGKVGGIFTLNIRMIDISTGKIVHTDNVDCRCTVGKVLSKSTVEIAEKAALFVNPDFVSPNKKSFWKSPWTYVGAAVILAGGGTATYFLLQEPEKKEEEKSLGVIIPVKQ